MSRNETAATNSKFQRDEKMARVEAVLFVANEPLSSRRIAQVASLADGTEARTLIRRLNQYYDVEASAFRVEQVAGGYQLLTRPQFGGWLRRLHQRPVETRLSAPAMESLAVVAYRQPVVRAEIESIRGVQCGEILRQLMDRDLVRIVGRSEELGRPFLYGTTKRFLRWSGLRSLDELPRAALLRRKPTDDEQTLHEITPAARRDNELTPRNDLNEESEVKIVASPESALIEPLTEAPLTETWNSEIGDPDATTREPWVLPAVGPRAEDEDDDMDDEDEDDLDDDDDDDYEDDDDDLDEDEDLDDEDLEDEEWEEVDDDEDDWDDEDEDWDEDDEDEDEDEDWDDE